MIAFEKNIKNPLTNTNGFTLMELMVVVAIVASLAAIAIFNYMPARAKAMDAAALSDARNIVSSVVDAAMNNADVDFFKFNTGGAVGDTDTSGNPRKPIFSTWFKLLKSLGKTRVLPGVRNGVDFEGVMC